MLNHRDADISIESHGDTVSPGLVDGGRARPDTAEIEAARRREGLRPSPRPTRPPGLDVHTPPAGVPVAPAGPPSISTRDAEIDALQNRVSTLEALVERDEEVLRKLLALLVEKGVATREEILERIRG
jgi:hypothetical protein